MSDSSWRVDDFEQDPAGTAPRSPALVTMHFLLAALRRKWRVWVGLGCVGMLLGLGWTLASPPKEVGTVTLMLAHEPSVDPQQALSTDMSLLRTRTLAAEVVERLGLDMTPEAFQDSVVGVPASTDVLALEVSGPDAREAVRRTSAFADAYLAFRASQLRSQLEALNRVYEERASSLQAQGQNLSEQYEALVGGTPENDRAAVALLNEQAQARTELQGIRRSIQEAALRTSSIIDASYVLDPATSKPAPSDVKAALLAMASGLIGGTATGVGIVLMTALVSSRLRMREEVALALDTPVRISVGTLRPRRSWGPVRRARDPSAALHLVVEVLYEQVVRSARAGPPTRLALATVDNTDDGRLVMGTLAARLSSEDLAVVVLDLSESGGLDAALGAAGDEQDNERFSSRPVVHRPDRASSLARGPGGSAAVDACEQADVVLALAEVDPRGDVEQLSSWVDEVVVLVTAGRSSAERLRTTAELIRSAGLRLDFAIMIGTDRSDESLGLPGTTELRRHQPTRSPS